MRYTTVIDISENRTLYKNHNARLVYLHLALKSGYHDTDRDLIDISIRELAWQVGITVSACRHALKVLAGAELIQHEGLLIRVKKWLIEDSITPRSKSEKAKKASEVKAEEKAREAIIAQQREAEKAKVQQLVAGGKTPFMVYYEGLQERAKNGDLEAQNALTRHKATYEAHKAELQQRLTKKTKK